MPGEKKEEQQNRSMIVSSCITVWEAIKEVFILAVAAPPAAKVILFFRFGLSVSWPGLFSTTAVALHGSTRG